MSKIRPKDLPNIGSTYNGGTVMIDGDDGTVKIPASDLFSRFGGLTTGNGLTGSGTSANPIAIDSSILNDINGKQDALEFDGTYDAETNPAATLNTALSTSTDIYLDTENGDDTLNGRAASKALHTYSRALEIYSTLLATGVDTRIVTLNGSLPVDTATTVRLKVYSPVELSVSFTAETRGGLDISSPENITVDVGTAVVSGNIEMKSGKRLLIGTGNNPSVKEFNMHLQARTVVLGGTLGVVTSNEGTMSVFGGNVHVIADTLDLGISMAYGVSLDVAVYTLNVVNTASFYCKDQNFSDHVSIVATECTGASDPSTISFSGYRVFIHVDTMADGSSTPYFFSNNNGPIPPLGNDFDINIGKYASPYALIHCVGSEITHNIRVSIGEDGCTSHVGLFVVGQQYTNAKLTGVVKMVPNDLMDYDYTGKGIPVGFYGTYEVIYLEEKMELFGCRGDRWNLCPPLSFVNTYNNGDGRLDGWVGLGMNGQDGRGYIGTMDNNLYLTNADNNGMPDVENAKRVALMEDIPEPTTTVPTADIFIDETNGDDANDGNSAYYAVKTYTRAYALLEEKKSALLNAQIVVNGSTITINSPSTTSIKIVSYGNLSVTFGIDFDSGIELYAHGTLSVAFSGYHISGDIYVHNDGDYTSIYTGSSESAYNVYDFNMYIYSVGKVFLNGVFGKVDGTVNPYSITGGTMTIRAKELNFTAFSDTSYYGVNVDAVVDTVTVSNTPSFYCADDTLSNYLNIAAHTIVAKSTAHAACTIATYGYKCNITADLVHGVGTVQNTPVTMRFVEMSSGPVDSKGSEINFHIGKFVSNVNDQPLYVLAAHYNNAPTNAVVRCYIGNDICTGPSGWITFSGNLSVPSITYDISGVIAHSTNDGSTYFNPAGQTGTYDVIFLDELESSIGNKQDALAFDGTYNATTNKVATVSTVTQAVASLDAPKHVFSGQFTGTVNDLQLDGMLSDGTYTFQLDSTIVSKINICTNPLIMVTFYAEFWCPSNARPTHDTTSCLLGSMRANTIRGYRVSAPITSINGISSGGDDNFADFGFSIILDNVTNALPLSTFPFEFRNVPSVVVGTRMEWTYSVTIFDK